MIRWEGIRKIVLVAGATDLRKGIDGYAAMIQDQTEFNPFDETLYLFCNRDHNKLKCLYRDGTGFWLLYKRLEKGHFQWKKKESCGKGDVYKSFRIRWLKKGYSWCTINQLY